MRKIHDNIINLYSSMPDWLRSEIIIDNKINEITFYNNSKIYLYNKQITTSSSVMFYDDVDMYISEYELLDENIEEFKRSINENKPSFILTSTSDSKSTILDKYPLLKEFLITN